MKLISLIVAFVFLVGPVHANDKISKFVQTKLKTKIEQKYSKDTIRGKTVAKVYAYWERPYYVFLSAMKTTLVTTPFQIDRIINSHDKLIQTKKEGSYFVVNLLKGDYVGPAPNLHVIFENGKSLLLNIEISDEPSQSNQVVTFLDAVDEWQLSQKNTKKKLEKQISDLKQEKEGHFSILDHLLFNTVQKSSINAKVAYNQNRTQVELDSVQKIGNKLYFNIIMTGELVPISKENSLVEIQNFDDLLIKEYNATKQTEHPTAIIRTVSRPSQEHLSIVFEVPDTESKFYSKLALGQQISFHEKIDFESDIMIDKSPFNMF